MEQEKTRDDGMVVNDKIIGKLNLKFGIHFKKEMEDTYIYSLPPNNWMTIKNGKVDSSHWYDSRNNNIPCEFQPGNEEDLEGVIRNLISINSINKGNWYPRY
jgi:hypothetical protein